MVKHVYQSDDAVVHYDRSHGLSDSTGRPIAAAASFFDDLAVWLADNVRQNGDLGLLDIGVGHGGCVFLPLLTKLSGGGRQLTTLGIDNSRPMLDEYRRRWVNSRPVIALDERTDLPNAAETGDYWIQKDVERLLADLPAHQSIRRFDVVLLTGVLHHVLNWRATISSVVEKLLTPDGLIVLGERDMDSDYFDGNFYQHLDFISDAPNPKDIKVSIWRHLWTEFYRNRARLGVPWDPEIRISDVTPCASLLLDMGFVNLKGSPYTGKWCVTYTASELSKWIAGPAFSNFSRGISAETRRELIREFEKLLGPDGQVDVTESWRYYALRRT